MSVRCSISAAFILTTLDACSLAPPYHPPQTLAPTAFKEAGDWLPASPVSPIGLTWWTVFNDPTLNGLEQRIETENPTLAGALARYDRERAYLGEIDAATLPHLSADTALTRNRQSDNRPLRGANQPDYYSADTTEAGFSYEFDLWGRVRNAVAAGKADVQAVGDDLAAIKLNLESDLATDYVVLRSYDQEIDLLADTVKAYDNADHTTRRRFAVGIVSGIDVGRSGAELEEARAQLAAVRAARAITEHAIASLVGTLASDFNVDAKPIQLTLPDIPLSLPSSLLQQRPDIAGAERRVASANAQIGIARAAFFPSIALNAGGGYQNTGLTNLISAPNLIWSIGPTAAASLFDGGRRRAAVAAAQADWLIATASYRARVLAAFQDVEDQLSQLHHLRDQADAEARAVLDAGDAERLSLNRYDKGAVSYLEVVTAQTTALRTRRATIELQTHRLQAAIRLIRALGGGWTNS